MMGDEIKKILETATKLAAALAKLPEHKQERWLATANPALNNMAPGMLILAKPGGFYVMILELLLHDFPELDPSKKN